jgi:hypothetical protein
MPRFGSIAVGLLLGVALSGCTPSAYSTRRAAPVVLNSPATVRPTTNTATTPNQSDPQKMQAVADEMRRIGEIDPTGQRELLDQMSKSDPSLWQLEIEQYRATAAYRRQMQERTPARQAEAQPVAWNEPLPTSNQLPGQYNSNQSTAPAARLPYVGESAVPQAEVPTMMYPRTLEPPAPTMSKPTPSHVVQASYAEPEDASDSGTAPIIRDRISAVARPLSDANKSPAAPAPKMDPRQQLAETIKAMEAEMPSNPTTSAAIAQHARLRMLYAAAGRRDDAMRPIPAASPTAQQFLAKELEGLTAWLNAEQSPDAQQRAAEVKPVLADALGKLAELAPLCVRNLSFCTEVRSYGCTKRFEKYEFQPDQEVLLYAEIENFASESTPRGYHTLLKSSYQVFDAKGQRVADHSFAATEEHCQNCRRDFFIGYHLRLPKELAAGKYRMKLTIEDLKSRKVGRASVEFEVKAKDQGGGRKGDEG